jgi:hypothetical protein
MESEELAIRKQMPVTYKDLGKNGRLGNAIFEMCAAIGLAVKHSDSYIFPYWQYSESFNFPSGSFIAENNIKYDNTYVEKSFTYNEIPYSQNLNLEGYYQSYKYFEHCKHYILDVFTMKNMSPINNTAIHVRRGDYINLGNSYYIDLAATNYYEQAMEIIGPGNYLIFSDDPAWCRNRFKGIDVVESGGDVIQDFNMLLRCENQIIANSSFSWWAAYLNRNPNKKVIAPKNWFGHKLSYNDTRDLIPTDWMLI